MGPQEMQERIRELEEALRPFAHPDLTKKLSANTRGDDSPVYGRNNATLTLGDFRRAAAALALEAGEGEG